MLIGSYHLTPTSVVELLINMTIAIIPVVVVDQITKLLRQAWSFFSSSNGDPAQERQLTAQPCQSPRDRRPSPARSEVTRAEGPMPSSSPSPSRHRRRSVVRRHTRRQEPRLIDYIDLTQDSDSEDGNIEINASITTNRDEESEDCSGRQYSPSMPRLIDPCCVCLGRQPETVLIPCGHFVCDNCAPNLHRCPICRSSFTNHYKTFR